MIYLILAIISSTLISVLLKVSEKKRKSEAGLFIFNYIVCVICAWAFTPNGRLIPQKDGFLTTLVLGVLAGIVYLLSFVLMQQNIKKNGVMMSSTFMKLGVIVSILIAVIFFDEVLKSLQIVGMVLAIAAIIIFNFDKKELSGGKKIIWLILLLIGGGLSNSAVHIHKEIGQEVFADTFLFLTFLFAGICSVILLLVKKEKIGLWDVIFGVIIGIPNYFSSKLLQLALNEMNAVVAYPVYDVATLLMISLAGIIFFKEKFSLQKGIGAVLVIAAVILLQ